jgi:galactokinase
MCSIESLAFVLMIDFVFFDKHLLGCLERILKFKGRTMGSTKDTDEQSESFMNSNNGVEKSLLTKEYNSKVQEINEVKKALKEYSSRYNDELKIYNSFGVANMEAQANVLEGLQLALEDIQEQHDALDSELDSLLAEIESL